MSEPNNIGVINPRALAEQVIGRRVRWNRIINEEKFIEDALQTPYEQLFDPKYHSLLYTGLERSAEGVWEPLPLENRIDAVERLNIPGSRHSTTLSIRHRIDRELVRTRLRPMVFSESSDTEWNPEDTEWVDKGDFFDEGCEFGDPEQGALADCYLIAAMGAVAWARPYVIGRVKLVQEIKISWTKSIFGRMVKSIPLR